MPRKINIIKPVALVGIPFFLVMLASRLLLYCFAIYFGQISFNTTEFLQVFGIGFVNDLITSLYFITPIALLALIIPNIPFLFRFLLFVFIYALCFCLVSEIFFWEEFGSRFNFIAVDYLIYRREVVGNINQSYPVIPILIALVFISWLVYYLIIKISNRILWRGNFYTAVVLVVLTMASYAFYDNTKLQIKYDQFSNELAQNGVYNFGSAFFNNSLDYERFYPLLDEKDVLTRLRKLINDNSHYVSEDLYNITRKEIPHSQKHKYNIMLISVESLSAEYMAYFGNHENLTPFTDSLIPHSLSFTNYYATGTRTVRGLEAMTLSIPPTPGNSIVRKSNNENLFSIGSVLAKEGYDNKFIYGGFGYFDNMNYFFGHNNFKTIDRSDLSKEEITFANVWGVADEDIFKKAITEADKSFSAKTPFFTFIMTTSNHRPFTYPDNKIDIPSGSGRVGAIKYTDYAIKTFIETTRTKPWFKNTIFIITADHCAGSAGKSEIPANKYHIPLIIYSPNNIKPKVISKLSSQIDLPPTIMGLLGIGYDNKFFGMDILSSSHKDRALLGTYQKLGYMVPGYMVILSPKSEVVAYSILPNGVQVVSDIKQNVLEDAITYYQSASILFKYGKLKE